MIGFIRVLKEHGYPVLMVNARAGADFGDDTMAYLGQLKKKKGVLLSVCTWHYAEVTGSKYSSFEELKFAHGNDLDILPLRVCDDPWPPEPPNDEDGKSAGLLAVAIPRSRVFVDCRKLSEQEIAFRIAEELRQGATPVGHGKKERVCIPSVFGSFWECQAPKRSRRSPNPEPSATS